MIVNIPVDLSKDKGYYAVYSLLVNLLYIWYESTQLFEVPDVAAYPEDNTVTGSWLLIPNYYNELIIDIEAIQPDVVTSI